MPGRDPLDPAGIELALDGALRGVTARVGRHRGEKLRNALRTGLHAVQQVIEDRLAQRTDGVLNWWQAAIGGRGAVSLAAT